MFFEQIGMLVGVNDYATSGTVASLCRGSGSGSDSDRDSDSDKRLLTRAKLGAHFFRQMICDYYQTVSDIVNKVPK